MQIKNLIPKNADEQPTTDGQQNSPIRVPFFPLEIRNPINELDIIIYFQIITYQCLLEAIVCEWRPAKRVVVTITFSIIGFILHYMSDYEVSKILFVT